MGAEVIPFPRKNSVIPTEEETESFNKLQIDNSIDRSVRFFVLDIVKNIPDIDTSYLEERDEATQKVLGLVRETMRATIYKLQGVEHELQNMAEDIIIIDNSVREQIIEDN